MQWRVIVAVKILAYCLQYLRWVKLLDAQCMCGKNHSISAFTLAAGRGTVQYSTPTFCNVNKYCPSWSIPNQANLALLIQPCWLGTAQYGKLVSSVSLVLTRIVDSNAAENWKLYISGSFFTWLQNAWNKSFFAASQMATAQIYPPKACCGHACNYNTKEMIAVCHFHLVIYNILKWSMCRVNSCIA